MYLYSTIIIPECYYSENEKKLVEIIDDITKIISGNMPKPKKSKICRKCAYFEFCFS